MLSYSVPQISVFRGHEAGITCMAIVGVRVYTGSEDTTAMAWDLHTGGAVAVFR